MREHCSFGLTCRPARIDDHGDILIFCLDTLKLSRAGKKGVKRTAGQLRRVRFCFWDIGYKDEDGYIFIVDRKKDLIIKGGFNIYPREVEEILYTHPAVSEAAVIGVQDPVKGELIKACIVLKQGKEATEKELIDYCRANIATYKAPNLIGFYETLPKNATGKILKRELRLNM